MSNLCAICGGKKIILDCGPHNIDIACHCYNRSEINKMDPKACLQRILDSMDAELDSETVQATSDLLIWILQGGALPEVTSQQIAELTSGFADLADILS